MNPAAAWLTSADKKRPIDLSWMTPSAEKVRPMFEPPRPPSSPPKVKKEPRPAPPPQPPGPSPEQLKLIEDSAEVIRVLAASLGELAEIGKKELSKIAEEIWEISLATAEELAAGAIETDGSRVIALIVESLEMLGMDKDIKVYLNPHVHDRLREQGLLDDLQNRGGIALISDPKLVDVGCIVESPVGRVDARVRSRLRQLRHLFAQKMGGDK
jgi:flagellar biosynthesis/type III secretory pathway protein FliH